MKQINHLIVCALKMFSLGRFQSNRRSDPAFNFTLTSQCVDPTQETTRAGTGRTYKHESLQSFLEPASAQISSGPPELGRCF